MDFENLLEAAKQQMAEEGVKEMFFANCGGTLVRQRTDFLAEDKEAAGESLFSVRNPEQITKLLNSGADIKKSSAYYHESPLIRLVLRSSMGQIKDVLMCAKLMIDAGVKLNFCDVFEDTALGLAYKTGQFKLAKFLQDAGETICLTLPSGRSLFDDVLDSVLGEDRTYEEMIKWLNQVYDEENWLLPREELKKVYFLRCLLKPADIRDDVDIVDGASKVGITKKRLKEKQQNKKTLVGVSGVVFADILAEKKISGEIKGDITPDMAKKLYTKYVRDKMINGK